MSDVYGRERDERRGDNVVWSHLWSKFLIVFVVSVVHEISNALLQEQSGRCHEKNGDNYHIRVDDKHGEEAEASQVLAVPQNVSVMFFIEQISHPNRPFSLIFESGS